MLKKDIPATLLAGMFFFSAHCLADRLGLAANLFEKGEWELCRRECRRALLDKTAPTERFRLLEGMSAVRSGMDAAETATLFEPLVADATVDVQVKSIAAYELGRLQWKLDKPDLAMDSFAFAFHSTTNKDLFLHAACSAFLLMKEHPRLKKENEALAIQINTSRAEWRGSLFKTCAKPVEAGQTPPPPNWIVRLYRSQISPAIGNRCTLEPSCSEYFHQAYCKHGLKSFAMIADRFSREPGINNEKKDPVVMKDGRIRYRDPIESHDFWMKK